MNKVLNALKFVWKNNKVWLLVSSIVMVVFFSITMVATQVVFLRNTISTVLGTERRVLVKGDPSKYQYFATDANGFLQYETDLDFTGKKAKDSKADTLTAANKLNEEIAGEGFVLLKNEQSLPLAKASKISVFGKNSTSLVYGGSGSGGGNAAGAATIYDSLKTAGFDVNPTLKSFYENNSVSGSGRGKNPAMGDIPAGLVIGETPKAKYTDSVKSSYSSYKDAAVVVFSRIGGEGFDLPRSMKTSYAENAAKIDGARDANDHYLQLDQNETDLLEEVCKSFDNVVVILNSSASMEVGFLDDPTHYAYHEQIKGAVWIASPGKTGVNALGKILNGDINPSGKLVDTYSRNFKNDPTWQNFSNNNIDKGNMYLYEGTGKETGEYFVEYEEDIYIGYRYYETRAYEALEFGEYGWYDENVVYPFGYGLSYTNFSWKIVSENTTNAGAIDIDGKITVNVEVTNNGLKAGKDVVQLYYNANYTPGGIEKPLVALADFAKTDLLEPKEKQIVTLTLDVADMASYDWNDKNNNKFKGYELDGGDYQLIVASDAHSAWWDSEIEDSKDLYSDELTLTYKVPKGGYQYNDETAKGKNVENRFDIVSKQVQSSATFPYLSRADFEGSMPKAPDKARRTVKSEFINEFKFTLDDKDEPWYTETTYTQGSKETSTQLYELIKWNKETGKVSVDYDDPLWDSILNQLTISEMSYLIGTGNFNSGYIEKIGKPRTTDPDGPSGFTNFMGDPTVYDTCFYAGECVVAATYNKALAHDMGVMIGIEGLWGNVKGDGRPYSGWYAPAVNIHRSPFSGRNFEYYSEDPMISGILASEVIQGAKSKGIYTYVKHFVFNDQETNRGGIATWLSEQAMREIYLRPFEIAVRKGGATAMMSSFNRVGTKWTGGSYPLMTEVLRNEWGFKGMVITDYNTYAHMPADEMIRAGGDLNLIQNKQPTITKEALTTTQISLIRQATKNILYTVAGSNAMNGMGEGVVYRYAMPMWMVLIIVANAVLFVGFAVWGFFSIRNRLKNPKELSPKKSNKE